MSPGSAASLLGKAVGVGGFAAQLYAARARVAWHGHVRRDPLALLELGSGRDDPYPLYGRLRERAPLVPTWLGNLATARHDLCSEVLRSRRFGVRPPDGPTRPVADAFDLSLLDLDPPDHTRLRRLAAPAFSAVRVAGYRPLVEQTVQRVLDDAERQAHGPGSFNLVATVAMPLPVAVITELLGVPAEETGSLTRHGALLASALDGIRSLGHARALLRSNQELEAMFERLFALRRHQPGTDVLSSLVHAEGERVRPDELVPLCTLLLVAGFETTVNLIGNAVLALLAHPEQWRLLREDPSLAPAAVEETLRWDPPVQRTARLAGEDLELGGVPVQRGQLVLTLLGGANRDPAAFHDPDRFDLTRDSAADHLAFSGGVHYCLGAPLARMEAAVALQAVAERLPGLRLAGRPVRRTTRTLRGPQSLPLALH